MNEHEQEKEREARAGLFPGESIYADPQTKVFVAAMFVGSAKRVRMAWQRPTEWSAETTDGTYYAEEDDRDGRWNLWRRGKYLGKFKSLRGAKTAARRHLTTHPPRQRNA